MIIEVVDELYHTRPLTVSYLMFRLYIYVVLDVINSSVLLYHNSTFYALSRYHDNVLFLSVSLWIYSHRWWDKPLTELKLQDCHISANTTCSQAVSYMKGQSLTAVPVLSDDK